MCSSDLENLDYGRYRDTVTDWQTEREYLTGLANTAYDRDYKSWADALGYQQWADEMAYQQDRDKVEDEKWQKEFDALYGKDKAEVEPVNTPTGVGTVDNDGLSGIQIKQIQIALGVTADGKYGEATRKAAGGLSAVEAYEKYVVKGEPVTQDKPKSYTDFSMEEHNKVTKENGGSYYSQALSVLKEWKKAGKSNSEVAALLSEMVGNSYLLPSDYTRLYQKYRDNKL